MSQTSRAFVAASVGVVEAMKDQLGICRWNHVIRSAQQNAKNHLRSKSQAKNLSPSTTSAMVMSKAREEKLRRSEESLRTVMYLSCWGPNWIEAQLQVSWRRWPYLREASEFCGRTSLSEWRFKDYPPDFLQMHGIPVGNVRPIEFSIWMMQNYSNFCKV
jgi:hypothetical protein